MLETGDAEGAEADETRLTLDVSCEVKEILPVLIALLSNSRISTILQLDMLSNQRVLALRIYKCHVEMERLLMLCYSIAELLHFAATKGDDDRTGKVLSERS